MSSITATLFVVATPIGNLSDMSTRAIQLLSQVDLIAAEDTRHSSKLLHHFGIDTRMVSVHEHNERQQVARLIEFLSAGKSIALISDAGTPLLSDPGYQLVCAARAQGIRVVPVPGACAAIAALSVSGLPCDRFVFEGFPPARSSARRNYFAALAAERRTLVFYESAHRVIDTLADMSFVFGPDRPAVVARELTKKFEVVHDGALIQLHARIQNDENEQLGEFVILVRGANEVQNDQVEVSVEHVLAILMRDLPIKQATTLAARLTGQSKNVLYRRALEMRSDSDD